MGNSYAIWSTKPTNFAKKVGPRAYSKAKKLAIDMFTYVVNHSPVESGSYRASWNLSFDRTRSKFIDNRGNSNVLPPPTIPKLPDKFTKLYVTNGAPYAEALENGWSQQAPLGILRQAKLYVK